MIEKDTTYHCSHTPSPKIDIESSMENEDGNVGRNHGGRFGSLCCRGQRVEKRNGAINM